MNEASDPRAWVKSAEEAPNEEDAREAIQIMKSVRAFARSLLGI